MPERIFDVESYKVELGLSGVSGDAVAQRTIYINGPVQYHPGSGHHATIHFKRAIKKLGYVGNVGQIDNHQGHRITASAYWDDFDVYCDLLRAEDGLKFVYGYDGPESGQNVPIRNLVQFWIGMGTSQAPGADSDEIFAHIEAQTKKLEG